MTKVICESNAEMSLSDRRESERGATLLTTLLVSIMLLGAGAALVLTTNLATTNATDNSTEMQAYYAAEAGLNAALNVLRGNVNSSPSGTAANYRNAADNPTLNLWLGYNATVAGVSVVRLSSSPFAAYSIQVSDPDSVASPAQPSRLLVRVTGYGPRGAAKKMESMVNRYAFDYTPNATLLMRGSMESPQPNMDFAIGESNAKDYSGYDRQYPGDATHSLPVFGTTNASDTTLGLQVVDDSKPNTVTGAPNAIVTNVSSTLPSWLQTADASRTFLNELQAIAQSNGRYFTGSPPDIGSTSNPAFTFIEGDASISGTGAGLLICTGTLTLNGNTSFDGLILVLGEGSMRRNGGGNGNLYGAIIVASFDRTWPSAENGQEHPFLRPTFDTNGGGNSDVQYDSLALSRGLGAIGSITQGVREY